LIMNALDSIIKKARKNPKKIVFPEALDERILKASEIILKKGIARVTLLGDVLKLLIILNQRNLIYMQNDFLN